MKELNDILTDVFEDSYQIERINKQETILKSKVTKSNSIIIGWTNLGISRTFDSVIGLKYYAQVESLMTTIIKESQIKINYFGKQQSTINLFKRIDKNEINNNDNGKIEMQIHEIRKIVKDEIEPIWEKLNSIQQLANHVNRLNDEELSEFLSNPTLIRKLAINTLADTSYKREDEVNRIKREYIEAENKYPQVFKNYSKAIEVFEKHMKSS